MYRLLLGHLSAGSESPRVEEAVTMIKSWFHGWSGRSLAIFDGQIPLTIPMMHRTSISTIFFLAHQMMTEEEVKAADMKPVGVQNVWHGPLNMRMVDHLKNDVSYNL
jgi:hypothetical protein